MLLLLLLLLLLPQSESAKKHCMPRNVSFCSVGMKNELIWLPPKNSKGLRYTVEYCKCDCNYWQQKLDCTNITTTRCDLTNETSNKKYIFYVRVTASNQVCTQKSAKIQLHAPYTEADCAPRNVTFHSENLKNKLIWLPPKTIQGVSYTVEYCVYGTDNWIKKLDCTNIILTYCDVTNETSNINKQYYGRVTAYNSLCCQSNVTERLNIRYTILWPPKVHLFSSDTSALINLTHPVQSHAIFSKSVKYHININGEDYGDFQEPYYMLKYLNPQTTYCVTAKVSAFGNKSGFSNKTCTTTKNDHKSDETAKALLCFVSVVLLIFILFAAAYGVHKYIHVTNVKQPHILNITTNNNKHAVLVEGNTVTINLITIDSGITNLQNTMMSSEKEIHNKSDLNLTDDGDDISHDSGVMEDDHEYITLQEQSPTTKSQLSPYDMPHHFSVEQARKESETLECLHEEQDLYGQIKSTSNIAHQQENHDLEFSQSTYMSNRTTVAYLPKNDHNSPESEKLNNDLCKLEDYFLDQDSENWTGDADIYKDGTLFLDWSPNSSRLHIPDLCNDALDEFCKEECHEVNEGLLSQLDMPQQPQEYSENDELVLLAERWGLNIQM